MTKVEYWKYLKSEKWIEKSKKYKTKFPICECCRKNKSVNVHHQNYLNVGKEKYWDLIALCRECHMKKHGLI
jgi:5-methylcytosine-specific restriction endonuclease McrA